MYLVHADGVIPRPLAVTQALAKRKSALVKCSSNGQRNGLNSKTVEAGLYAVLIELGKP
jgi:hypothetical protein